MPLLASITDFFFEWYPVFGVFFSAGILIVFVVLIILWALDLFVLHMIGGLIHVLLVVAVVLLIVHFLRGRP